MDELVKQTIEYSEQQIENTINVINNDSQRHPQLTDPFNGRWTTKSRRDWTSGFFSGCLWYISELTDNSDWVSTARLWTQDLESEKNNTGDHDVGFRIMSSFGHAYRLNANEADKEVIITAANALATRFDETIGCIRSWDFGTWNFPVIIDNMMNLELLFKAAELRGDDQLRDIAISHALKTIDHHIRDDGSTYHVVDFNNDGSLRDKSTFQGYDNESTWSRGQAWGLYGYTMTYRFTKQDIFLNTAIRLADYIIENEPDDLVPFYDYSDPNIPNVSKDASAAAISCAALFELAEYTGDDQYSQTAEDILKSLMIDYLTSGTNHQSIIYRASQRKDDPERGLIYADYYFLEALVRYQNSIDLISATLDSEIGDIDLKSWPNPASDHITIQYTIPKPSQIHLTIYNHLGQEIVRLEDDTKNSGSHRVIWDTANIPSGAYLFRLSIDGFSIGQRLFVVK